MKRGGCSVSPAMRDFDDWIILHDLVDLPLIRVDFTWSNTHAIPVMSRLEQFLVSIDWLDPFPDCIQRALARVALDQFPLLLEIGIEDRVVHPL